MKIRYYKKTRTLVITMDNGVDTIKAVGGEGYLDPVTITNNSILPTDDSLTTFVFLLYHDRRNRAEAPPIPN